MFAAMRARLAERITARQAAVTAAETAVTAAETALTAAQAAVPPAEQAAAQATQAQASAQSQLDTALAAQAARQAAYDGAAAAVTEWQNSEPDKLLPNGQLNPGWQQWSKRGIALNKALDEAAQALGEADAAAAQAQATRDRAAAAAAATQAALAAARQAFTGAQSDAALAGQALAGERDRLAALRAEQADLETQERRILAEPLDLADLRAAADQQLAEVGEVRWRRRAAREQRFALQQHRAAILAAADTAADDLAVLATAIRAWDGSAGLPALGAVADRLDGLVRDSRTQRARPTAARTDDLGRASGTAEQARSQLAAVLTAAADTRDEAARQLEADAEALASINAEAPQA